MKKLLILGGSGMLGYGVSLSLARTNFDVTLSFRTKRTYQKLKNKFPYSSFKKFIILDLKKLKFKDLQDLVIKYDYIINCAGIIKPEIDESSLKSFETAIRINSYFPRLLSKAINNQSTKVFQIATDCVFSGSKGFYSETDLHDQNDIYGMTKSLGEIKTNKNFYNLRTSIIGKEIIYKKSLLDWFLTQKEGSEINGFVNHYWNGVTTEVFGNLILTIIKFNIKIPNLLHIVPKNKVSKYELVKLFNKKFDRKLKIKKFKTKLQNDRTLKSNYSKINNQIWSKSVYKKRLTIAEMVNILQ